MNSQGHYGGQHTGMHQSGGYASPHQQQQHQQQQHQQQQQQQQQHHYGVNGAAVYNGGNHHQDYGNGSEFGGQGRSMIHPQGAQQQWFQVSEHTGGRGEGGFW